eukprot:TRINITY_DN1036_c2_g1_i1.p1 TRINITY_DN1036_c2_g1~~TRINITY_DN1036_c2_g1_i1.p1  ORF type:complete len:197 (-),score=64.47 TRINITY_DN1036_c2_g1_i1:90-680(-)
MIDSCSNCKYCKTKRENLCGKRVLTYHGREPNSNSMTYGGYSKSIVVKKEFVLHISEKFQELARVAPLICAGISTWTPLRRWNVGSESKVGVVGLGGLGHMAVKLAASMGAEVTVFSTSPSKKEDAFKLGATHFTILTDADALKAVEGTLDLVIDTVPGEHSYQPLVRALCADGVLSIIGILQVEFKLKIFQVEDI